jgi:hypothetical protein
LTTIAGGWIIVMAGASIYITHTVINGTACIVVTTAQYIIE